MKSDKLSDMRKEKPFMISLSYINNDVNRLVFSDPVYACENAFMEDSEKIDTSISSFMNVYNSYMTEAEIMGELSEDKTLYLEAESSNIFKTIGDSVISLGKKLIALIETIISKLKELGFKNKKDTDKLEILLKEHPDLKDIAIEGFNNGDLKLNDIRSLKELNDTFDELVKLSRQKNTNPKSLRGKWEKAKKKYEDNREKIEKTAKTVTAITTAAVAIYALKKNILDARKNSIDAKKKIGENNDEVMQAIDDLKKFKNGEYADSDKLSNAQILKNASAFLNGEYTKMVTGNETKVEKLHSSLNHFLHKYSDSDMELKKAGSDYKKAKADAAHQKERDEKIEDAAKSKAAQLKEQRKDAKAHKDQDINTEYKKAKARSQAQIDIDEKNKDRVNNREYEKSHYRTIGAENAKLDHYKQNQSEIDANRRHNTKMDADVRNQANKEFRDKNDKSELQKMKDNFETKKAFEEWRDKKYPKSKNTKSKNTK